MPGWNLNQNELVTIHKRKFIRLFLQPSRVQEYTHHPVLGRLECWRGRVEPGFRANFLGVLTRNYMAFLESGSGVPDDCPPQYVTTELPKFDEEYFQWIDLLESVASAQENFSMIELGAGYGRWLVNAVHALRQMNRSKFKLVGVEAEPTHFNWMQQHFLENGIDRGSYQLIEAAVGAEDGRASFITGNPSHWYGQSTWPPETRTVMPLRLKWTFAWLRGRIKTVRMVSMNTLLQSTDVVDLIDLDVQGSELKVLTSATHAVDLKVRRIHIGTHTAEVESGLRTLFQRLGWENKFDFPTGSLSPTRWGNISFQDGVQSWINPHITY